MIAKPLTNTRVVLLFPPPPLLLITTLHHHHLGLGLGLGLGKDEDLLDAVGEVDAHLGEALLRVLPQDILMQIDAAIPSRPIH